MVHHAPDVKSPDFWCDKVPHGGESCQKQCALCAEANGMTVGTIDHVAPPGFGPATDLAITAGVQVPDEAQGENHG